MSNSAYSTTTTENDFNRIIVQKQEYCENCMSEATCDYSQMNNMVNSIEIEERKKEREFI